MTCGTINSRDPNFRQQNLLIRVAYFGLFSLGRWVDRACFILFCTWAFVLSFAVCWLGWWHACILPFFTAKKTVACVCLNVVGQIVCLNSGPARDPSPPLFFSSRSSQQLELISWLYWQQLRAAARWGLHSDSVLLASPSQLRTTARQQAQGQRTNNAKIRKALAESVVAIHVNYSSR
jgi:hypothetical protein